MRRPGSLCSGVLSRALLALTLLVPSGCRSEAPECPPIKGDEAAAPPADELGVPVEPIGEDGEGDEAAPAGTDPSEPLDGVAADDHNACGGALQLDASPGWTCGPGDQGRWVCAGPNALVCEVPSSLTVCHHERGGVAGPITVAASDLSAHLEHGDYYGLCQPDFVWALEPLAAEERVVTEALVRYHRNACGGTTVLPGRLGGACGRDGRGTYECDGRDDLRCVESRHTTVCHVPPGNPGNAHTITVGASAVDAHLGHGDYLGDCRRSSHDRGRRHRGRGRGRDR